MYTINSPITFIKIYGKCGNYLNTQKYIYNKYTSLIIKLYEYIK